MMREDEGEELPLQHKPSPRNPLMRTLQSARRVQLAVRTSITSQVAKKASFDDESEVITIPSYVQENANIDQAMFGLYSLPDHHQPQMLFPDRTLPSKSIYDVSALLNQSSSYIPQDDWDPILDGGYRNEEEEQRSNELVDALVCYENSEDWKQALALAREMAFAEASFENDSANDEEGNEDDDDGFGDFQSAKGPSKEQNEVEEEDENSVKADMTDSTTEDPVEIMEGEGQHTSDGLGVTQAEHAELAEEPEQTPSKSESFHTPPTIQEDAEQTPTKVELFHTPPTMQEEPEPIPTKVELVHTPPTIHHLHRTINYNMGDKESIETVNTFSTIDTAIIVRRVDGLFTPASSVDDADLYSTMSNDFSTPALLAQSYDLLARVAQETSDDKHSDDDSDATPMTKSRCGSLSYATPSRQRAPDLVVAKKVSMQLPVTDLTLLENRWTRRRQLECQATIDEDDNEDQSTASFANLEEILQSLPQLYQIPIDKIDDGPVEVNKAMLRVLNSVPWGCIHLEDEAYVPGRHDLSVWDDFIAGNLSQLDSALEGVQKIMAASVKPEKLEAVNDVVHSCEQNLRLARIYWDRSSHSLNAAIADDPDGGFDGAGVMGNAHLLELWQEKEEFSRLDDLLKRLDDVTAQEKEITRRIDTFDATNCRAQDEYSEVVRLGKKLRDTVDGDLGRLHCLSELRDSRLNLILEERFWKRLKHLCQQNVVRLCRRRETPSVEYLSVVKAAFGLFEAAQSNHDSHDSRLPADWNAKFDEQSGWSKNIVDAIVYEAERCFAAALLEPIEVEDSAFVKDLKSLEQEVGKDWGDYAKLKTLTHNLVTIRFDFERPLCYLPRVMVRLCECLLDVLRGHFVFHQIHCPGLESLGNTFQESEPLSTPGASTLLGSVAEGLRNARNRVWEKCESTMIHALKEYQNFASKIVMFREDKADMDDSVWEKELQGLHTVQCAILRFSQYKPVFFGDEGSKDMPTVINSPVLDVLRDIASEHVHCVHVEAMKSMGRLLSREAWYLVNFDNPDESEKKTDPEGTSLSSRQILSAAVLSAIQRHKDLANFYSLAQDGLPDRFSIALMEYSQLLQSQNSLSFDSSNPQSPRMGSSDAINSIFDSIDTATNTPEDDPYRIATQSIAVGLVEWASRLVMVSLKVPVVAEKVCASVENIFDLYFTTVFRLCAGSRRNERIILGEDAVTASTESLSLSPFPVNQKRGTSPVFRGFGQETKPSGKPPAMPFRHNSTISSTLDIEICAPMQKDIPETVMARCFIDRAQQELHGNVNLNRVDSWFGNPSVQNDPEEYACSVAKSVERREAAAWSCLVATALAEVVLSIMSRHLRAEFGAAPSVERFRAYVQSAAEAIPVLSRKASEVSCTRAFSPSGFVKEIVLVGAEWEESKLHEQPNDYVEGLCERASLIWGFIAASGKLPRHLVVQIWVRLQTATYMTLLEGFSRVAYCSAEGRALMALDVASVFSSMRSEAVLERLESFDLSFSPPPVTPRYGKQYVDLYVKVFYYPQEDALAWISQNFHQYRMNHMLSLVSSSGFGSRREQSAEVFDRVRRLYDEKQEN